MSKNNNHTIYRDGFDISPNYWGEEKQEHAPDEVEALAAKTAQAEIKKNINNKQEETRKQLPHPLEGMYGCP